MDAKHIHICAAGGVNCERHPLPRESKGGGEGVWSGKHTHAPLEEQQHHNINNVAHMSSPFEPEKNNPHLSPVDILTRWGIGKVEVLTWCKHGCGEAFSTRGESGELTVRGAMMFYSRVEAGQLNKYALCCVITNKLGWVRMSCFQSNSLISL